jgi:hypothetical protein
MIKVWSGDLLSMCSVGHLWPYAEKSASCCQFGASFAFGICIAGKISQANTQETEDERMQLEATHQRNFWMAGIGHDMT